MSDFLRYKAQAEASGIASKNTSVIFIWLPGGLPHMETYDIKPEAPSEYRGDFRPIRTNVPGIEVGELLPMHAKIADKFSLVRSCHHDGAAVHDAGWQIMQTGRRFTGGIQTPHAGSVSSYLMRQRSDLPPSTQRDRAPCQENRPPDRSEDFHRLVPSNREAPQRVASRSCDPANS